MEQGYSIYRSCVDLTGVRSYVEGLAPHRGVRLSGEFWHSGDHEPVDDLCVWWTEPVDLDRVSGVLHSLRDKVVLDEPYSVYCVDCVWSSDTNAVVRPHVDTPYRFSDWQGEDRLLAQQFIVPLVAVDAWNGATGVVPNSHHYIWPIDRCYAGAYDEFFAANCVQPELSVGDVLTYDPRLLHSTMPNYSGEARPVLLVSYVVDSIVPALETVDEAKR